MRYIISSQDVTMIRGRLVVDRPCFSFYPSSNLSHEVTFHSPTFFRNRFVERCRWCCLLSTTSIWGGGDFDAQNHPENYGNYIGLGMVAVEKRLKKKLGDFRIPNSNHRKARTPAVLDRREKRSFVGQVDIVDGEDPATQVRWFI